MPLCSAQCNGKGFFFVQLRRMFGCTRVEGLRLVICLGHTTGDPACPRSTRPAIRIVTQRLQRVSGHGRSWMTRSLATSIARVSSLSLTDLHAGHSIRDRQPGAAKERCHQPNPLCNLNRKVVRKAMRTAAGPMHVHTHRLANLADGEKRHEIPRKPCAGVGHPPRPALDGENRTRAALTAARED